MCACVIIGTLCQEQSHALNAFPDTHMGMRRYAKNYHLAFATILQGWCPPPPPFSAVNGRERERFISSGQIKMVSIRSEKPIWAPPLSAQFWILKQFHNLRIIHSATWYVMPNQLRRSCRDGCRGCGAKLIKSKARFTAYDTRHCLKWFGKKWKRRNLWLISASSAQDGFNFFRPREQIAGYKTRKMGTIPKKKQICPRHHNYLRSWLAWLALLRCGKTSALEGMLASLVPSNVMNGQERKAIKAKWCTRPTVPGTA